MVKRLCQNMALEIVRCNLEENELASLIVMMYITGIPLIAEKAARVINNLLYKKKIWGWEECRSLEGGPYFKWLPDATGLLFERIAALCSTFVVHKEEGEGRGGAYSRGGAYFKC